jgi:hypothetical protein
MAVGLSSPLPCPTTAKRARGTRGSLRHTLVGAAGVSGSHPPLLRFSREGSAATARTRNVEGSEVLRTPIVRPLRPSLAGGNSRRRKMYPWEERRSRRDAPGVQRATEDRCMGQICLTLAI